MFGHCCLEVGTKQPWGRLSFVSDCIKKGLKVYASEEEIVVDQINSTWFTGYDDQYFKDKGTLGPYLIIFSCVVSTLSFETPKRISWS